MSPKMAVLQQVNTIGLAVHVEYGTQRCGVAVDVRSDLSAVQYQTVLDCGFKATRILCEKVNASYTYYITKCTPTTSWVTV